MTKSKKAELYIKDWFEELSINYKEFFYYDFEEGNFEDIEWYNENGEIDLQAVAHAAKVLGIHVNDIMTDNDAALQKWLKKYPYFVYVGPFNLAYEKTYYNSEFDKVHFFEVIFEQKYDKSDITRFQYDNIILRLKSQLKEFDKVLPGFYHHGANITNLSIDTENFCEFDKIHDMVHSFISMINRIIELFIKAVQYVLNIEEISEYNLLVSVLGLRDINYPKGYLYYDTLINVRHLYKSVTTENFYDSIIFQHGLDFQPWRCSDFVNDKKLVTEYLSAIPHANAAMRKHASNVLNFICDFVWSDTEEYETVLIKKTADELSGDDMTAQRLLTYCHPEKTGGISIHIPNNVISNMQYLLGKIPSNNYIECIVDKLNKDNGGCI